MAYLTAVVFLASLAALAVSSQVLISSTLKLSRWFRKKKLVDNADILLVISLIPLFLLLRGKLDSLSGFVLVIVFALYVLFVSKEKIAVEVGGKQKVFDVLKQELVFGIALILLTASSKIAVSSAVTLADFLGLPYATIGLTIVSLGTTMPELAVNISSMFRRKYSLALGNILGSCVANLTLILGIGAMISGNSFDFLAVGSGIAFLLIANVLLTFTLLKFNCIPKRMGWVFIAVYLVFITAEIGLV
ncbi:hypothetical protein HZB89_00025, partial [archaeon]|nr:hypothetical protein [archaeon]